MIYIININIKMLRTLTQLKLYLLLFLFLIQSTYQQCSAPTPYSFSGNCYEQCPWIPPNLTYLDGTTCVTDCSSKYQDDYTRECVSTCPIQPILTFKDDNQNRCVEMCSTNPSQFADLSSNTCFEYCPAGKWGDPDTRHCVSTCPSGKFYQIYTSHRLCVKKCYPNYYANLQGQCVAAASCPSTPVAYYGDDSTNLCVKQCPYNKGTFAETSTRKCVYFCALGTFADTIKRKCVSACPVGPPRYYGSNTTRTCHLQCIQGEFGNKVLGQCVDTCPTDTYGDYSTNICVETCPQSEDTYADSLTNLCVSVCPPGYYADDDQRSCVQSTDCSRQLVGNPLNLECVDPLDCPVLYFINTVSKLCVRKCQAPYWANTDTRYCMIACEWNPPAYSSYYDATTRTCVEKCPSSPRLFALNNTQKCVTQCPTGFFGLISTYECVKTCPTGFHSDQDSNLCVSSCTTSDILILYYFTPRTQCISACPEEYYADNTTMSCVETCPEDTYAYQDNNTCLSGCPNTFYADDHSQQCVQKCPKLTQQYADDSTNKCVHVCPVIPDYYGQDLNDGNRKCVSACTLVSHFADPRTRTCVLQCNVTEGYYGYSTDHRCYLKCPVGWANPLTSKCVATCPQSPKQMFGDNLTNTCVARCPNSTYGDKSSEICLNSTDCPSGFFGDDATNLCVNKCSQLLALFGDPISKKCASSCPHTYYADNTSRKCSLTCNLTAKLYKDPSTKRCVNLCPVMPDLYADPSTYTCVPECPSGYAAAYNNTVSQTRKCVSMCPSTPSLFADQQNKKCVTNCANLTYKFINNTYRGCLSTCPPQIYTTQTIDLYTDNSTWKCVSVCPSGYFAFKHPSITTIRDCVPICHKVGSVYYFSQNKTRKCVTECPFFVYHTYGDKINFQCVQNCSRDQFRDNITKLCTYECSNDYFADNTTHMCVKECPVDTFAETINKTCVLHCPKDYFGYTATKKCQQTCDHWRYFANNISWLCVQECSQFPDYYQDPTTKQCVNKCSNGRYAQPNGRKCSIALNCQDGRVADPISNKCLVRCTSDPMYFVQPSTNLCGQICQQNLFADNTTNTCVKMCPAPYYGVNSTTNFICVQYCPLNEYKYIKGDERMCLSDCPEGRFADDVTMSCLQICSDYYYGNQGDNTCILDCQPLYADDENKQCVQICSDGTTASNNSYKCQDQCDYHQFQFEKVCHSACTTGYFADNLTRKCVQECPDDPFTFSDPINNKCHFICPQDYYALSDDRTCVEECPTGLFKQLTLLLCISPCPEGTLADPNSLSCQSDCTDSVYTFIQPFNQTCVDVCPENPDLYGYNDQKCVQHCPTGLYAQNFTRLCVLVCPNISAIYLNQSYSDNLTHRCVERCSAQSYSHQTATHNLCLNQCPDGFFASEILQKCTDACPDATFAQNLSKTCVYHCPNGEYADINSKICMDRCDHYQSLYMDNSTNTCVDQCPEFPSMFAQQSTMQCVLACQITYFAYLDDRTCLTDCPDPYFADGSTGRCVLQCPIHEATFGDQTDRQCVSNCVNRTENGNLVIYYADMSISMCVAVCSETPQKLYGYNQTNNCEITCPEGTYGDNDTRLCLDECVFQDPKYTWMDQQDNFCVTLCPEEYYADNNTGFCEADCSNGLFADHSTRRCVATCPVNPALFGYVTDRRCIDICPVGLFADQTTRICVNKCPTTPSVYYHYTPTSKCVLQCLYPYYAEKQSFNCVQVCQDGFYGNLTTHKCEICKPECVTCTAFLECTSCITNYYLYENSCVVTCPSYPIMYYAHIDNGVCFLQCPAPYFGQKSTGLCKLSCQTRYYGNMNTRVCTQCPIGCLTCDIDGCYTCQQSYTHVQPSLSCSYQCNSTYHYFYQSRCYLQCPDGSYLSTIDLVTCLSCNQECGKCSDTASNCTTCAFKFYYNGKCVNACPQNFFVDQEMICTSCTLYPSKCILQPLRYTIHPFTKNYKQQAYVVFNRAVDLSIDRFNEIVQIKYNGVAVSPSTFTTKIYNQTTYWITFNSISLNQNSLSIGFQPGAIIDYSGNYLTVNELEEELQTQPAVTQQIAQTSETIESTANIVSWIILAIILIFLIKSGYPFLIALQCVQMYYMLIFLKLSPMPYLELKFLDALKNVNLLFIPTLFPDLNETSDNYVIEEYEPFLTNTSFLYNSSPFIVVFAIVIFIYLLFFVLSRKSFCKSKAVRHTAHKIRKYRLKYMIINDAFWFTYLYAVYMAVLQFTQASIETTWDIVNIIFAAVVFLVNIVFTVFIFYIGKKYKDSKPPKKYLFLKMQPSSFPMEIPLRYLRKLLFCLCLLLPSLDAQCILIIVITTVFLLYLGCFMPSDSLITNIVNISIQISYITIVGLFYGYNRMEDKSIEVQMGFSITMITIQGIILFMIIVWIIYRGVLVIKNTNTWSIAYKKMTENKNPQYLREQQRKRDLQFDLGSLENRTFNQDKDTDEIGSSHNIKLAHHQDTSQKFNIFQVEKDEQAYDDNHQEDSIAQIKKNNRDISSSHVDSRSQQDINKQVFQPRRTQELRKNKNKNKKGFLEIRQENNLNELEQIQLTKLSFVDKSNLEKASPKKQQKRDVKAIWDDIEFDDNQI